MQSNYQNRELPKAYDSQSVEQRLYQMWIDGGYFTPKIDPDKTPFVIMMPPPNVTGELHLGHALTATLEDIMIRWHRMKGDSTLWLPGADHAGIATQVVVERSLAQEGLTRQELGREKFLEKVWEWVNLYGSTIDEQHKRIGASCDWTRRSFTLDPGPSHAVQTTFVNMYKKQSIYRGERIINWCPRCSTALSDLEVDHQEEQSFLYHIKYQVQNQNTDLIVATTRPETLLGDTAVAVNPDDPRYKALIGSNVLLPIINRPIRIIGDEAVDPDFGTGALKVTPAHDPVDFEVGQRHGLDFINVMNLDGTMNEKSGPYIGMDRVDCRNKILEDLEVANQLEQMDPYNHSVGHCGRCGTLVEPMVSNQWFMRTDEISQPAMEVVLNGQIKIIPERFSRVYLNWMENIRDWCISRQLWWGHRIPAWYCLECSGSKIEVITPVKGREGTSKSSTFQDMLNSGISKEDIESKASHILIGMEANPIVGMSKPDTCVDCGSAEILQDPDVLDTWFSSALWPHSTMGWPDNTDDFNYFYPTAVMETGYDILFFWVARMIMMGIENTGEIPFSHVYLSGLIRDEHGIKMSKTRGNVIDPINAIDNYGTDALRFALTTGNAPGNDMRLSQSKLAASRNFINKVWNAARFVLTLLEDNPLEDGLDVIGTTHTHDRWIISRLNKVTADVNQYIKDFQFGEAQREAHDFFWNEFCDWYIEMAKIRLRSMEPDSPMPTLVHVLEQCLRLMHPFLPFITEELWQTLKVRIDTNDTMGPAVVISQYPEPDESLTDNRAESQINLLIDVVRSIRNVRAEFKIPTNVAVASIIETAENEYSLEDQRQTIENLARTEPLIFQVSDGEIASLDNTATIVLNGATILISLQGLVDTKSEKDRLSREAEECTKNIQSLSGRLNNAQFLSKAPEEVVEKERERLSALKERKDRIDQYIAQLSL